LAVAAVFGVVLGAWYMLWLVQRVFFGPLKETHASQRHSQVRDLSGREIAALVPLAVFVFWIGLHPEFFLARMRPAIDPLASGAAQAYQDRFHSPRPAVMLGSRALADGEQTRVD
jgi:NADH-quinone oxidoreductase subunit M